MATSSNPATLGRRRQKLLTGATDRRSFLTSLAASKDVGSSLAAAGLSATPGAEEAAEQWDETLAVRREIRGALGQAGLDAQCLATNLLEAVQFTDPKSGKKDVRAIALAGKWRGYDAASKQISTGKARRADPEVEREARRLVANIFGLDTFPGEVVDVRSSSPSDTADSGIDPAGRSLSPAPLPEAVGAGRVPAQDRLQAPPSRILDGRGDPGRPEVLVPETDLDLPERGGKTE